MNRLREIRMERGITQDELGRELGVQKAAICKYETGRVAIPPDTLMRLCDFFGASADFLMGRDCIIPLFKPQKTVSASFLPVTDTVGVPLVGRVHAGLPILADENITEYVPIPTNDVAAGEYFYMEVEGDCMVGEFIPEGSLVLVRMQPTVENGRIAVVRLGDEVLLRKVKRVQNGLMLIPANTRYEPMLVSGGDAEIIGRVVEVRIRGL
ncbi:MAG TPA: XRE family transcriptional regulator [Clostridia bacterium]|nr:XRE family transcriptional regulator [Clostridia bacterium]